LKDIENYKLVHVQDALQQLDRALMRLESATARAGASKSDAAALAQKLDQLTRAHSTLKESAARVASRLDAAIGRLSAAIED
jgi:hypothetical protein